MAAMSRKLRTPVNAIIGFSEMIKNELLDPTKNQDYKTHSTDIYSSGRHFLAIITDILNLAKIEAAGLDIESCFPRARGPGIDRASEFAARYCVKR